MTAGGSTRLLERLTLSAALAIRAPRQGRFPFKPPRAIERAQNRRVRRAIAHAYEHVPYYRETLRRRDLRPDDFRTAADLARLPVIEREDLQRDPEYFVSRARPIESYVQLRTGATSGRSVTVFFDAGHLFQEAAHGERRRAVIMNLAGKRFRYRAARIVVPGSGSERAATAFGHRSFIPTATRVVERHLSVFDPPERNAQLINDLRPDVVGGHGSYIAALFRHVHAQGIGFHAPKVVTYGADPLSRPARRLITEQFGSSVLSLYGSVEMPAIGFECEHHTGHHVNVDLVPLRIVGPDGADVPRGDSGDVVVSNLVNRGTMLFNYRLGDIASWLPAPCPCGRSLPLLSFVEGRIDDWIRLPSGRRVHPQTVLDPLEEAEEIWQFQVVQEGPARLSVAVVTAGGCDRDQLHDRLVRGLAEQVGGEVEVVLSFVEALPRSAGGKTRLVVADPGSG